MPKAFYTIPKAFYYVSSFRSRVSHSGEEPPCAVSGSRDEGGSSGSDSEDPDEGCELWAKEGECYKNPG